jgi:hypothetical protein
VLDRRQIDEALVESIERDREQPETVELPNVDEALAKVALAIATRGSIRGETLRAFTEDEYRKLIASLP